MNIDHHRLYTTRDPGYGLFLKAIIDRTVEVRRTIRGA